MIKTRPGGYLEAKTAQSYLSVWCEAQNSPFNPFGWPSAGWLGWLYMGWWAQAFGWPGAAVRLARCSRSAALEASGRQPRSQHQAIQKELAQTRSSSSREKEKKDSLLLAATHRRLCNGYQFCKCSSHA